MPKTTIEDTTPRVVMFFFSIISMLLGLAVLLSSEFSGYIVPAIGFGITAILVSELGWKRFGKISRLKKFTALQWTTLVVAVIVFVNALYSLPVLALNVPVINDVAGAFYLLGGVFIGLEVFIDSV